MGGVGVRVTREGSELQERGQRDRRGSEGQKKGAPN